LTRELGLEDKILFLGKQDAIENLLSIADVFLLTSETESFGLAALEAMACRVPCVSTNAGGLPEVNIEGETGYLSNVGDIENMAANCLKILSDSDTHEAFKANALAQAKRFSIDAIVPQYEALYHAKVEACRL
jgi:glycosyltransferase involved in cell wall biosynthesis